jgi:hypothetical protein
MYTAVKPEIHVSSSSNSLVRHIKPQAEHNIRMASILLFYIVQINEDTVLTCSYYLPFTMPSTILLEQRK